MKWNTARKKSIFSTICPLCFGWNVSQYSSGSLDIHKACIMFCQAVATRGFSGHFSLLQCNKNALALWEQQFFTAINNKVFSSSSSSSCTLNQFTSAVDCCVPLCVLLEVANALWKFSAAKQLSPSNLNLVPAMRHCCFGTMDSSGVVSSHSVLSCTAEVTAPLTVLCKVPANHT